MRPNQTRTIDLVTADGVRLVGDLWAAPQRRVALAFAHGFTGSAADPDVHAICRRLVAAGISVLVTDLRGHGRSGGRSTVGDREPADVAASVAWLRAAGYSRVVTAGWSMGAATVLRYAAAGGDTDAVISVSSPAHWFDRSTNPMRLVHWACETRTGRLACRVFRHTRLDASGWAQLPASAVEVIADIPTSLPLLVVHGTRDPYFALRHGLLLAEQTPHAQLWIEDGMGHAESGTSPQLSDRLAEWIFATLGEAESTPAAAGAGQQDG